MSDNYVKDPMNIVKVGDVLEFRIIGLDLDRRRISLSRKSEQGSIKISGAKAPVKEVAPNINPEKSGEKRRLLVKRDDSGGGQNRRPDREGGGQGSRPGKPPGTTAGTNRSPGSQNRGSSKEPENDGTMYNPFADAFKKMKTKK